MKQRSRLVVSLFGLCIANIVQSIRSFYVKLQNVYSVLQFVGSVGKCCPKVTIVKILLHYIFTDWCVERFS